MADTQRGFLVWLQDNARILLSIALVLFLLFAVYSYSKRTANTNVAQDGTITSLSDLDGESNDLTLDADVTDIALGDGSELMEGNVDPNADIDALNGIGSGPDDTQEVATETAPVEKIEEQQVVQPTIEQTASTQEGSIVVSAGSGDGMTHLARRATTEYINANSIDYLSAAQRVFIEDTLQRAVPATRVHPGTSASFENAMIKEVIQRSQDLSPAQLATYEHYAKCILEFQ